MRTSDGLWTWEVCFVNTDWQSTFYWLADAYWSHHEVRQARPTKHRHAHIPSLILTWLLSSQVDQKLSQPHRKPLPCFQTFVPRPDELLANPHVLPFPLCACVRAHACVAWTASRSTIRWRDKLNDLWERRHAWACSAWQRLHAME